MTPRVAYCIPTCNPVRAAHASALWKSHGYSVWLAVETGFPVADVKADHVLVLDEYPGYFTASNRLAHLAIEDGSEIVVFGGDDIDCHSSKTAEQISAQYLAHFPDGFGVMQPTGDTLKGTNMICGSPWVGRGWVERAYDGNGPLWPGYYQFFGDEELLYYARQLGVLWQRPDLTQFHHHWMRKENGLKTKTAYQTANDRHWKHDEDLFRVRRAAGFPSHELQESAVAL